MSLAEMKYSKEMSHIRIKYTHVLESYKSISIRNGGDMLYLLERSV